MALPLLAAAGIKGALKGASGIMGMMRGGDTPKYQGGGSAGFLDQETLDWLKKQTGGSDNSMVTPDSSTQEPLVPGTEQGQGVQVAGSPQSPSAEVMGQPMPGQEPMPTISNPSANTQPAMPAQVDGEPGAIGAASSVMQMMSQQKDGNDYAKDSEGYTSVNSSGDIIGGSVDNFTKGDVLGGALELAAGFVAKGSQQRKKTRELQMSEGMHDRAQQNQSSYSDPNSVYYSAKDGAPISQGSMKRNLSSMMNYQSGGGTNVVAKGEQENQVEKVPGYVTRGRSHKYSPNDYLSKIGTDQKVDSYSRNLKDIAYDIFHPNKPARIRTSFQDGGGSPREVGRQADLYPNGSVSAMMNPVNEIKVRENKRKMVSKGRDIEGNKFRMVTKKR